MFYSIFKFELLVFAALSENLSAPGFIICCCIVSVKVSRTVGTLVAANWALIEFLFAKYLHLFAAFFPKNGDWWQYFGIQTCWCGGAAGGVTFLWCLSFLVLPSIGPSTGYVADVCRFSLLLLFFFLLLLLFVFYLWLWLWWLWLRCCCCGCCCWGQRREAGCYFSM